MIQYNDLSLETLKYLYREFKEYAHGCCLIVRMNSMIDIYILRHISVGIVEFYIMPNNSHEVIEYGTSPINYLHVQSETIENLES